MRQKEQKAVFIRKLASFLAEHQMSKSIVLEEESSAKFNLSQRPRFAHEWAELRQVGGIKGWPTVEQTIKDLESLLA